MREVLAQRAGLRGRFSATFERPGSRTSHGYDKPMFLFLDVRDENGTEVTDHIWFDKAKIWDALALKPGDRVQFEARVATYWKGYIEKRMDYKLAWPRHAVILNRPAAADATQMLLFS